MNICCEWLQGVESSTGRRLAKCCYPPVTDSPPICSASIGVRCLTNLPISIPLGDLHDHAEFRKTDVVLQMRLATFNIALTGECKICRQRMNKLDPSACLRIFWRNISSCFLHHKRLHQSHRLAASQTSWSDQLREIGKRYYVCS